MTGVQRLILILAGFWIIVKLGLFYTGNSLNLIQVAVSLNIAFVLFIIFNVLQSRYATEPSENLEFLKDFTAAMKATSKYILIIFGFLVIYYLFIDKDFINLMIDERVDEWKLKINEEGGYASWIQKLKEVDQLPEGGENVTEAEYFADVRSNFKEMINLKILLPVLLLGLFFLNVACSAVFSAVYKSVIGKKR